MSDLAVVTIPKSAHVNILFAVAHAGKTVVLTGGNFNYESDSLVSGYNHVNTPLELKAFADAILKLFRDDVEVQRTR